MATTASQYDTVVRRQVFIERFKASEAKRYEKFLRKVDSSVRDRLSRSDLTEFGRARLKAELRQIREILDGIYEEWGSEFEKEYLEFSELEAKFERRTLKATAVELGAPAGFSFAVPTPEQLRAAVFAQPLSIRRYTGSNLLKPFIKDFTDTQKSMVISAIRQGYFEGQTNAEIVRVIRGTRAEGFRNGILETSRSHATAIVRTSVQHVASVARFETWSANDDIIDSYRWVSTLDSKTTIQCRSLDNQVFELGKGPKPPIHPGCRSTTIAEFKDDLAFLQEGRARASREGQVEDQTYYEWLKTQPKSFQEKALGPTRAKLFRDGGISAERFAELNLGRNFQPMTLAEMREQAPAVFEKAGV